MIRSVLLVEDVAELRSVLRQALRLKGGFEVVAEADSGAGAVIAAARSQPDIVVLDLSLPDLGGHEILPRLRAVTPGAQIVVYTGVAPDQAGITTPVEAFVTKDHDVGYLVDLLADLGWRHYDTDRLELGPDPKDVALARRFVAECCSEWGCEEVVEDAKLLVSELVTNALIHGRGRCELRAGLSEAALRLQVVDTGEGMPDPQDAGEGDEHGRGLLLVTALSAAWGVETLPDGGKIVWAELLRPLDPPDSGDPFVRVAVDVPGGEQGAGHPNPGVEVEGGKETPGFPAGAVDLVSLR